MGKINDRIKDYNEFFSDELDVLKAELVKAGIICDDISGMVSSLTTRTPDGKTIAKGGISALAELIASQVSASSNRVSINNDIIKIKKLMIDYAMKDSRNDNSSAVDAMAKIISEVSNKSSKMSVQEAALQASIQMAKKIDESPEDEDYSYDDKQ